MLSNRETCKKYDLSSVRLLFTGAAPTGKETAEDFLRTFPTWKIGQGYGIAHPSIDRHNTARVANGWQE
jgi:acyl-coenzyme A synthetase/AMP-(fatty) acid ligase